MATRRFASLTLAPFLVLAAVPLVTPASAAAPSVALELVTEANFPTYVWNAGDGRLFIVERDGPIRVYVPGQGILPTPFLDLTSKVGHGGERGLYAIAFHPAYASNGYFFVSHAQAGTSTGIVSRYRVSADPNVADPASEEIVVSLFQPTGVHNAGQIAFGPDGYLYVSFGDGGGDNDANCHSQTDDVFYGKMLRLDVDQLPYAIPAGNPFVGAADPLDLIPDEIWAKGYRNPWRFSFDRANGDLLVGDVGQDSREEVDYQTASGGGGQNYGWKVMEGTSCHDPDPIDADCPAGTPSCFDPAYTPPAYEFTHGGVNGLCAIMGGFVYRGTAIAGLQGRYVFGDLCSGLIWALEQTSPGVWGNLTTLAQEHFLRTFGEDAQGELYIGAGNAVFKLIPGAGRKQTRLQQDCINAMNGRGANVSKTRAHADAQCIKFAGQRRLGSLGVPPTDLTVRACMATDTRGQTAAALGRLAAKEASTCLDPTRPQQLPEFGYRPSAAVGAAAVAAAHRLTRSLFGADPDAAIAFQDQNAAAASCQAAVAQRTTVLLENVWRVALGGKRLALAGAVGQDGVGLPADLAVSVLQHVDGDQRRMIQSQVAKLQTALGASCAGQPLDVRFPGDCRTRASTAAELTACVRERARCHFCRALEAFDGLTVDCDAYDDGTTQGSCPTETEIACGTTGSGVNFGATEFDCPQLAQYRLFLDPADPTRNADGGIPYDLTTPLFSDYALKYRFVFLPQGTHATYQASQPFDFPVGTIIAKTFSFAHDLRNPSLGEDVVETRLLIRRQSGWQGLPYVWLPDMSDALLTPAGDSAAVGWIDLAGSPRATTYHIPSETECGFCHFGPGDDPIGPKARLLNRDYPYATGTANQIDHWSAIGALAGAPPSAAAPRLPVWNDPADGTLEQRARAYLETNCAHCHNPEGRASFTGLTLLHDQPLDESYGICKLASDGVGGLTQVIVPGSPDDSIMLFRMRSVLEGERMPEIERSVVHDEGVALVDAWVQSLAGTCP